MPQDDPPPDASVCPACSARDAASFEAENGRFRVWCPVCGHSTTWQPSLELAGLEWTGCAADDEAEWQDL